MNIYIYKWRRCYIWKRNEENWNTYLWNVNGMQIEYQLDFLMVYDIDLSSGERTKLFGAGNHILYEKELQAELPNHIESAGRLRVYCLAKLGTPLTMGFPASSYCFFGWFGRSQFWETHIYFLLYPLKLAFSKRYPRLVMWCWFSDVPDMQLVHSVGLILAPFQGGI